jgi:hypothetical protein
LTLIQLSPRPERSGSRLEVSATLLARADKVIE